MRKLIFPLAISLVFSTQLAIAQNAKHSAHKAGSSIIESKTLAENHKTLLEAVKAADLEKILGSPGPFTIFAPSDNAFSKFSKERIIELLKPENKDELLSVLPYHIVAGNLSASKILQAMITGKGSTTFTTVQGNELLATFEGNDILLMDCAGKTARITSADTLLSNGVVHEIDSVILPAKLD